MTALSQLLYMQEEMLYSNQASSHGARIGFAAEEGRTQMLCQNLKPGQHLSPATEMPCYLLHSDAEGTDFSPYGFLMHS